MNEKSINGYSANRWISRIPRHYEFKKEVLKLKDFSRLYYLINPIENTNERVETCNFFDASLL